MAELIKTDEELAALQGEEVPEEEAMLDTDLDIEIVPASELDDVKPQALLDAENRLAELQAEKEALKSSQMQQESIQAALESVRQLQEQLKDGIKVNQPQNTTDKQFDFEAFKKDFNQNIFKDPAEEVTKFMTPFLQELNQKVDSVNAVASINASKAEMLMDDSARNFYSKHKEEIDKAVTQFSGAPDAYQKALNMTRMQYIDELVEERVAEQLQNAKSVPQKPHLTNVGTQSAPAVSGKTRITPGMHRYLKSMHDKVGWDMNDPDNIARAQQLRKEGKITD